MWRIAAKKIPAFHPTPPDLGRKIKIRIFALYYYQHGNEQVTRLYVYP
jgi:hypothetical protein